MGVGISAAVTFLGNNGHVKQVTVVTVTVALLWWAGLDVHYTAWTL